jgi:hypothetical protein
MKRQKIIAIVFGILVVGGIVVFLLTREGQNTFSSLNFGSFHLFGNKNQSQDVNDNGETSTVKNSLSQTYTDGSYDFSFRYPDGFTASSFPEGETGYVVLVQKSGGRESFQIFISDFDESDSITPDRIKKDIPGFVIESPAEATIGEKKDIHALIFLGQNESLGKTREIWFVREGNLYQVTTYADMDNLIGPILETWKFD